VLWLFRMGLLMYVTARRGRATGGIGSLRHQPDYECVDVLACIVAAIVNAHMIDTVAESQNET
jgi:hypothetical protein